MEAVDISFYLDSATGQDVLDVPVTNGEIVSINLKEDLPEDSNEIIHFLEGENCSKKFWLSIAAAYFREGNYQDSLKVVLKAIELQFLPEDLSDLHIFQCWVYLRLANSGTVITQNLAKAEEELRLAQQGGVQKASLPITQTAIFLARVRYEQALDIFDKLLKIRPDNCLALLGKAQLILRKTKDYSTALKLFQEVLMLNPLLKPDPRLGIGVCFWLLKDESMAIKSFERALEIDPDSQKAKILLVLTKFNAVFNNSLSDESFIEGYTACFEEISSLHSKTPNDPVILLVLSSYYFAKQKYELVEKIINFMVKLLSGDETESGSTAKIRNGQLSKFESTILSQCSLWLGRILFVKGDFAQAQKSFHEAIKLDDDNLIAKLGLAQAQISCASTEEAAITLESILKTNPKCLEVNYTLGLLYSSHKSRRKRELSISILERYLRLANERGLTSAKNNEGLELLNKEPVILHSYLVLSRLYEQKDLNQSLHYLRKAIQSRAQNGLKAPLEVYNNVGVFNYLKNNNEEAVSNFKEALCLLHDANGFKGEDGTILKNLSNDLKITLTYNLARSDENVNPEESVSTFEKLIQENPNYFSAKLRLLFLDCVSALKTPKEVIKAEIDGLLRENSNNIEIRSFFGWFTKTFGKKLEIKPDTYTDHHKETLMEYQSHDCYALLTLANIYCSMAREIKGPGNDEKKKKYYLRSIELYSNVLSIDPKNVYAAQGLAIFYIENKETDKGLDILRKIRDSLDDISVYLNLGHVLIEKKQFTKAIESYEIALNRFTDGKDPRIISLLGRSWMLRGLSEKNIEYLKRSVELSEEALQASSGALRSALVFNITYVQFQIAELLTKLPVEQRSVKDIEESLEHLPPAIDQLNLLASEEEQHPPYPKSDLKARANLGANTLMNRLNSCLDETNESILKMETKLEAAKKVREEEHEQKLRALEEINQARKIKEEELDKERAVLQEQVNKWAEEAQLVAIVDDEEDQKLFEEESSKEKNERPVKKNQKREKKRKKVVESDEDSETDPGPENSQSDQESKRTAKSELPRKKKYLSKEIIQDSDEEVSRNLSEDANEE